MTERTRILSDTPRHAGPQATDAAHDQVDLYARLRGAVERLDNLAVDQGV